MKAYTLCCAHGHRFEGWFSSEQDSRDQLEKKTIQCPMCESAEVERMPSAPRLNLARTNDGPDPLQLQAKLMTLLRQAAAAAEDVGERFADEARRMHHAEIPERAIRGTSTGDEILALAEEGIAVMPLPPLLDPKQTLQ